MKDAPMHERRCEAYQFFSRSCFPFGAAGTRTVASRHRPDIHFRLTYEYVTKPFEMAFAQLLPQHPSPGAHEFIDPDVDIYFSKRWPICLRVAGTIQFPDHPFPTELRRYSLAFVRKLLWEPPNAAPDLAIPPDQRATLPGYRREFFHRQLFDFQGNRRPSDQGIFAPSDLGEPIGPGLVFFSDEGTFEECNEFVWSPILAFPQRSTFDHDKQAIQQALAALRRQYNSYSELSDARRHLERNEIKAAVRSAASAVEAYLRHLEGAWGGRRPAKYLPFDEKIESVLVSAGKPSYKAVEPTRSKNLLYLYKARNAMHEGDCYYDREDGHQVRLREASQAESLIEAVESFVLWADSVV